MVIEIALLVLSTSILYVFTLLLVNYRVGQYLNPPLAKELQETKSQFRAELKTLEETLTKIQTKIQTDQVEIQSKLNNIILDKGFNEDR